MRKYTISLFISVISVSFAAIFILSSDAPPLSIAFYRLLFTTLLLLPVVILRKKSREHFASLSFKSIAYIFGVGVVLALHFAFWISSLYKTSVASSVILVTAHPIMVAPISHYLFKEKVNALQVGGILISILGLIILVTGNYGIEKSTFEGNLLAILGGAAAGIYILSGRRIRRKVDAIPYAFMVYAMASLVLLILCLLFSSPLAVGGRNYEIIFLMALVSGIFGHTLYNWVLKYVPAYLVSVSFLGEPISSSFLAFIIPWIHQVPSYYTIIGGCMILTGIYLTARYIKTYEEM